VEGTGAEVRRTHPHHLTAQAQPAFGLKVMGRRECKNVRRKSCNSFMWDTQKGGKNMAIKALFLDFYGTVVHEDDDIIPIICREIIEAAEENFSENEVSRYWWEVFSKMFQNSFGDSFVTQRKRVCQEFCVNTPRENLRLT
jgi:hypothetical protein